MTTPHHNDEEDDYDLYLEECIYCGNPAAHCRCDAIYWACTAPLEHRGTTNG